MSPACVSRLLPRGVPTQDCNGESHLSCQPALQILVLSAAMTTRASSLKEIPLSLFVCILLVLFVWRTLTSTGMTCHPSSRVLGALLLTLLLRDPPSRQPSIRAQKEGLGRENTRAHPLLWNNCMQMATLRIHSLQVTRDEGCSQGPGMRHEGTGAIGGSGTGCLYVSVDRAPDTSLSLYVRYAVCAVTRSLR